MRIELGFTLEFQIYEPVHLGGGDTRLTGWRMMEDRRDSRSDDSVGPMDVDESQD